ncbi:hypothetical protein N8Z10_00490 [bacterium]|nr:hypothetical protein [bacterium]
MNNITIECVWSPSRREFNKIIKDINRVETKVIDYIAIKKKLIKADPYCEEPNSAIVGFTIINEITRFLRADKPEIKRVIYLFKNLELEIVENFKELIDSRSEKEVSMELTIVQSIPSISDEMRNMFDRINIIKG